MNLKHKKHWKGGHMGTTPKHTIMKLLKTNDKMKNLKSAREKGHVLHTEEWR